MGERPGGIAPFQIGLHDACGRACRETGGTLDDLRPFVCKGSPLDCKVFVVGLNPASADRGFWTSWDEERGSFDSDERFDAYRRGRVVDGKSPVSRTRGRITRFTAAAEQGGASVLEANAFPFCAANGGELPKRLRDPRVFEYLVQAIRPAVVVAHGDPALRAVGDVFGVSLARGAEATSSDGTHLVGAPWHFGGQGAPAGTMSDSVAASLGQRAAKLVTGRPLAATTPRSPPGLASVPRQSTVVRSSFSGGQGSMRGRYPTTARIVVTGANPHRPETGRWRAFESVARARTVGDYEGKPKYLARWVEANLIRIGEP